MSLNIDPRRYHSCCCVQGITSLSTHMMVRVYDMGSVHRQKLANVLVDVHGFTMGNGRETPLFRVSALKEALRRQLEAYQRLIIYAYKGTQQEERGWQHFVVDTAENGPHDHRELLDVLADDVCFPQDWTIVIEGKDVPCQVYTWCYIEPMEQHIEVPLSTDVLITAGELKRELKKRLWPDTQDLPSHYLSQILIFYQAGSETRLRDGDILILDYAARRHNHFHVRLTDYLGQFVPSGHLAHAPVGPPGGTAPNSLRWVLSGRLPPLHRSVDCSFEYPPPLPDGSIEGKDGPVREDVSYFNAQPGTTASAASAGLRS